MENVAAEINVCEEGERREVETIKPAMDPSAYQGDVGHNPWRVAAMAHGTTYDASPILAWASVLLP